MYNWLNHDSEVQCTCSAHRWYTGHNDLYFSVQSQGSELSDLIDNVNGWWAEFETARSKVAEMREELTDQLPLGGSSPYVMKQDEEIQVRIE